jgi:hypothetical protein
MVHLLNEAKITSRSVHILMHSLFVTIFQSDFNSYTRIFVAVIVLVEVEPPIDSIDVALEPGAVERLLMDEVVLEDGYDVPLEAARRQLLERFEVAIELLLGDDRYLSRIHQVEIAFHNGSGKELEYGHPAPERHETDLGAHPEDQVPHVNFAEDSMLVLRPEKLNVVTLDERSTALFHMLLFVLLFKRLD